MRNTLCSIVLVVCVCLPVSAYAGAGVVYESNELVVIRTRTGESCAIPGKEYSDFTVEGREASWLVRGFELPAGSKLLKAGGISKISWEPEGESTRVSVRFDTEPASSLVNALPGTELRPKTPQVVVGFGFPGELDTVRSASMLGRRDGHSRDNSDNGTGNYDLPKLPDARYSDALVTLNVRNTDFREVLWLLSQIGGVSIMLDPYWDDEPTGTRRPPGGPGGGGDSGGEGYGGGGGLAPPREGTGNLTLNFNKVPFDQALELVVMSAGLVKVDIWPDDL